MARKSSMKSIISNWSKRPIKQRILQGGLAVAGAGVVAVLLVMLYTLVFIAPSLPDIKALTEYEPKMPLRVYTADRVLIAEFGEERRQFVPIKQVPKVLKDAVIATEDEGFYDHGGVSFLGIARAAVANLSNSRSQGASTITMQVARTFLLTRKKTYTRKLQEVLLAYRIESELSKDKILELYMNQIYLGERAYGFASAARIYFGKPIKDITLAQAAMLAGLPKAPASANPVVNPKRAIERQQYILRRMRTLKYISDQQYATAAAEKMVVQTAAQRYPTQADYAAEVVRQYMYEQYQEKTYTSGFDVYTTLLRTDQDAAVAALRRGVLDYERRHGYRGPEAATTLPAAGPEREQHIDDVLLKHRSSGDLRSAMVLSASSKAVRAVMLSGETVNITGAGLRFAASGLSTKAKAAKKIQAGSVIRVVQDSKKRWAISQLPEVSAAFVAINANDGSIRAMVGGFDFALNQFDHVGQAWRQPGSAMKPFIYSAALEKGFSPATLINDAPLSDDSEFTGRGWNPVNDNGNYDGPVTMRTGLKQSKNLVSIRILREISPDYAQQFITRFGFAADKHPANLTMSLGSGSVTPLQLAGAYAIFANGGYQIAPYLIDKIVDAKGKVLLQANVATAGDENVRVLDARNAYLMDSMLKDVVRSGTAHSAGRSLGRSDLAGKTGTTNDAFDGWFAGYGGDIVGVAWMGYDTPRSLGSREFGSSLAMPIWTNYMRAALRGKALARSSIPAGVVQVDGDYMYQEYFEGNAIRELDIEQPNFIERLFNIWPSAPSPAQRQSDEERRRYDEMYGG